MLKKKPVPKKKAAIPAPAPMPSSAVKAVRVPRAVLEGINTAREYGNVGMETRTAVVVALRRLGYHDASLWVLAHPTDYADGLVRGFEAE